jgi:hypothetical protein
MITSNNKCSHSLTISRVGNANNRYIGDIGVGEQTVLNLERVNVLATTYNEILYPASDGNVSI